MAVIKWKQTRADTCT